MYQQSLGSIPTRKRRTITRVLTVFIVAAFLTVSSATGQQKYDHEHPEVQRMIQEGLDYIVNNQSNQIGNRVIYGMAAYKARGVASQGNPQDHPLVDAAIAQVLDRCTPARLENSQEFQKMYASALACIFLLELDAEKYRRPIENLIDHIYLRQQDSGGWGYREFPLAGDTSQMQYIALALWLAKKEGFEVDTRVCKGALEWMVETQRADGAWLYQQPNGTVRQVAMAAGFGQRVRHSLVAAGLGTVYLYADLLQLIDGGGTGRPAPGNSTAGLDLPPDVIDVTWIANIGTDTDVRKPLVSFDTGSLYQTMGVGNSWFAKNFKTDVDEYNLYFLYGFERYASLRECIEGDLDGVEDWYDRGVERLMELQESDGSIAASGTADVDVSVQTAFGILFLTRSMSLTIDGRARGTADGGKDFPKNQFLEDHGTRIVAVPVDRSVGALLNLLESPYENEWSLYLASLNELELDGDKVSRSQQLASLRMLVMHEHARARLLAVQFLSKQRSFDNVPAFIYALTDPEQTIAIAANKALRFVSRKTSGFRISDNPTRSEINALKQQWTEWFLKVQPDGVLLQSDDDKELQTRIDLCEIAILYQ